MLSIAWVEERGPALRTLSLPLPQDAEITGLCTDRRTFCPSTPSPRRKASRSAAARLGKEGWINVDESSYARGPSRRAPLRAITGRR
jgi:hypothetical protein